MKKLVHEFRDFAMRGNVVDMAVGIVIGSAFTLIVRTLVDKVIMPPLGLLTHGVNFSELRVVLRRADPAGDVPEVAIHYGELASVVFQFLIVAWALFMVVKGINAARLRLMERPDPAPPGATPEDVLLLRDIRDLLRDAGPARDSRSS